MPSDCIPTIYTASASPENAFMRLSYEERRPSLKLRTPDETPQHQFMNQLAPSTRTTISSLKASSKSKRSFRDAASRTLSLSLDLGKATIKRTKPVLGTAAAAGKRAVSRLNQVTTALRGNEAEGPSSPSSCLSSTSLFHRPRLPKLHIPEIGSVVEQALNSVCSTDTQQSPSFGLLELSPTSRDLRHEWTSDDHPEDVAAEFHNILSARRRVRKGKFGVEVARYCRARPTWDDSWASRATNDNHDDRALLRSLTDALQAQKDQAARLAINEIASAQ
ncbi:hypothetical protein SAMD00023353_2800360 [Rosellinia necatrix]|uniref:Uncharacterized protein n=1 Tax=Rosellinia necatrix TaxID=77044 RepID=A0A1W2THV9_ROSNE|nr:hypothetical protein SAMD00023353_2800360 [Rosellinia necatrix]